MTLRKNRFDQPVGPSIVGWTVPPPPPLIATSGEYCRLEPMSTGAHAEGLSVAFTSGVEAEDWTYLPFGPFETTVEAARWVEEWSGRDDVRYYAFVDPVSRMPKGVASFMRIDPSSGCVEIGGILYSRSLSRTAAATEGMFMMLNQVFELGYRRCEWKCDSLNEPSRRAAERLGFSFEGVFRQATMYKGRSRDTAWYAITDDDWPLLRDQYSRWLDTGNFDPSGRQKLSLSSLTRPYLRPQDSNSGHLAG